MPTPEGQERLEVIAENTRLGAGYSIAMRDLEMRGAGELLGTRQHGYIASVGLHLYTRLLARAVLELHQEQGTIGKRGLETLIEEARMPVQVDLPLSVGLESSYVPEQDMRLRLYRRMADLASEEEIRALEEEFVDRFGSPPELTRNLFYQMLVKVRTESAGLESVTVEAG